MTTPKSDPPARRSDLDRTFSALGHETRRLILTALAREEPRGEDEFEHVEDGPDDTPRETTRIQLRHAHLPKLDEAGFVDWDRRTGTVTRGTAFGKVRPFLDLIENCRDTPPDRRS